MTLPQKLSYGELVKILADQQVSIERTDKIVGAIIEQLGFHDYQILKARLEMATVNRKYPFKLRELEDSFKGFVAHHEKNPHFEKKEKSYEVSLIEDPVT